MRSRVVTEAREEYLIDRKFIDRQEIEKLSDDEVRELYYRIIEENSVYDEANVFFHNWCRNNR